MQDDLRRFLDVRTVSHGGLFLEQPASAEVFSRVDRLREEIKTLQTEEIKVLQSEAKTLCYQVAIGAGDGAVSFPVYIPISIESRLVRIQSGPKNHSVLVAASGSLRDRFLILTLFLLSHTPFYPLAKCPECDEIFYRRDARQKFCRRRCANLASTKRFVERHKKKKGK